MWRRRKATPTHFAPPIVEFQQPEPVAAEPDYSELGEHVAGLVKAAEEAADRIRAEAEGDAREIRRVAGQDASAELGRATKRRQDADREAQQVVAAAKTEASEAVASANRRVEETLEEGRRRQEAIREETRSLEDSRRRALRELRELSVLLDHLLAEVPPSEADQPTTTLSTADDPYGESSFLQEGGLGPVQDRTRNGGNEPLAEVFDSENR